MAIVVVDPTAHPGWDELVLEKSGCTFFHSSLWARVLTSSYGFKPRYLLDRRTQGGDAVLPLMGVYSALTGKRGVGLPFSDYCPPLVAQEGDTDALLSGAADLGRREGWRHVEIRGGTLSKAAEASSYWMHSIALDSDPAVLHARLERSFSRNVAKAEREGIVVERACSLPAVRLFCRLNDLTRKRHGLPPQPFSFFRNLYEAAIERGFGQLFLARHEERVIAGALFLHFGEEAIYKYGASDFTFSSLRPNNLVMWTALKWYSANGYRRLSLGRTSPHDLGLVRFKEALGATRSPITYFRYDLKTGSLATMEAPREGYMSWVARRTPLILLKAVGAVMYRHFG